MMSVGGYRLRVGMSMSTGQAAAGQYGSCSNGGGVGGAAAANEAGKKYGARVSGLRRRTASGVDGAAGQGLMGVMSVRFVCLVMGVGDSMSVRRCGYVVSGHVCRACGGGVWRRMRRLGRQQRRGAAGQGGLQRYVTSATMCDGVSVGVGSGARRVTGGRRSTMRQCAQCARARARARTMGGGQHAGGCGCERASYERRRVARAGDEVTVVSVSGVDGRVTYGMYVGL